MTARAIVVVCTSPLKKITSRTAQVRKSLMGSGMLPFEDSYPMKETFYKLLNTVNNCFDNSNTDKGSISVIHFISSTLYQREVKNM